MCEMLQKIVDCVEGNVLCCDGEVLEVEFILFFEGVEGGEVKFEEVVKCNVEEDSDDDVSCLGVDVNIGYVVVQDDEEFLSLGDK